MNRKAQENIEKLSKEEILKLVKKIRSKENAIPEIEIKSRNSNCGVLSFPQQRLWFLIQLEKESPFYNVPLTFRITGKINFSALEKSINLLIRRHDSFRTEFFSDKGQPFQRIIKEAAIELQIKDLRLYDADSKEAEMHEILKNNACKIFNLEKAPLVRGLVIRMSDEESILGLCMHHIIFDGWSVGIFIKELGYLYEAYCNNKEIELEYSKIHYLDFAEWQIDRYKMGGYQKQLSFWKNTLGMNNSPLALPTDKGRPPIQRFKGARYISIYPKELYYKIEEVSNDSNCTLFMMLLACFYVVMYRYSNQSSINIGTPVANRKYKELEKMIGFFVNTIVMKADIKKDDTFKMLLQQVKAIALDAFDNDEFPFEKVVEELQRDRDQSYNPFFQVMFVFQNAPIPPLKLNNLAMSYIPVDVGTSKFDITFQMTVLPEKDLEVDVEYNTDLYEKDTIERMVGHMQSVMEIISSNINCKIDQIPLLRANEIKQFQIWNDTKYDFNEPKLLHHMFTEQVNKTPNNIAVVYEDKKLTYMELDNYANQVANYIIKMGAGPEKPIGIFLKRSLEMIVGIIGILKSGSAYLPIDPELPEERIKFIIEDSQVGIILTETDLLYKIPDEKVKKIDFSNDYNKIKKESTEEPKTDVKTENMAYIIYTSGSTGKPKGVINEHRSICNRLSWMRKKCNLDCNDRIIQKTPYTFDVSIWEFILPIITGARLYIAKPGGHTDSKYILNFVYENKITVIHFVPSMLRIFLQEQNLDKCKYIKQFFCSGEALTTDLVNDFYSKVDAKLINLYGPTEAAIDVTCWECKPGDESVPIGYPISNINVYVLDSNLKRVPIGVVGELYLSGIGVARGYLNREELTKKCFIPNPFNDKENDKLYKTGDLVKFNSDGSLEYIGRRDFQVKIRGIRVELGEVETAILKYPDIKEVVCIAQRDSSGSYRLIAYCVSKNETLDTTKLREFLHKLVPEYEIPSLFIPLKKIPLSSNGKIDRKALPSPNSFMLNNKTETIKPRNDTEKELVEIWKELLGIKNIGIEDSFFELGGHSLLAIQLVSKIRDNMNVEIPLRKLLSAPRISSLATLIKKLKVNADNEIMGKKFDLGKINPDYENEYEPFSLNDVQQAYWIGRNSAYELGNTSAHLYIEIEGKHLELKNIENAVNIIINRHPMMRAVMDEYGKQRILKEVPKFKLKVFDFSKSDIREKELLKVRNELSHQMFKTDTYPLFNITASIIDRETIRLHFSLDLLIGDALSWYILFNEMGQLVRNPNVELPKLQLTFRDYVFAEKRIVETEQYKKSYAYWKNRLKTLAPPPELPYAKELRLISKVRFKRYASSLDSERWNRLKNFGAKKGVTPSVILLGAFSTVLARWSKNSRFTLNLSLFNRLPLHEQINQIIGDFTSLTLLEVDMSGKKTFGEYLSSIQEQLWDDLDHRYFNGIKVLREIAKSSDDASKAIAPVVFTSTISQERKAMDASVVHKLGNMVYGISQTPQIYFDHSIYEDDGTLFYHWDIVDEVFPENMIHDMFTSYTKLVERIANNLDIWDEIIDDVVPSHHINLYNKMNSTDTCVSKYQLHSGVEKNVREKPDNIAVISENYKLTYKELSIKADELALWLVNNKVKQNEIVAVVMEKGWEQIVAALGILKSKAAYLAIDPSFPTERIHYLLKNSDIKFIVTQPSIKSVIEWPEGVVVKSINKDLNDVPKNNLSNYIGSREDLAYIIYTSGSTGIPKGVEIQHKSALNTIIDINSRFNIMEKDSILAISSLGFDLSVYDIFGMLNAGGTIVVPDKKYAKDPAYWLKTIHQYNVTVWNSVPVLMSLMVDYAISNSKRLPDSLRLILLSGDWIPTDLPDKIRSIARDDIEIISLGGATEAAIWSVIYPIKEVNKEWKSIPYGHAMKNQKLYVLDDNLEVRPIGVSGDIYIGGIGVAKGYLNDKERTEKSFIIHPVSNERLYRTGDVGKYLPNGEIAFLGRKDSQVKIHGYRVELGEIEMVLKKLAGIKESIVAVKQGESGESLLIGYVILNKDASLDSNMLRNYLYEKIPEYMVPDSIVFMDKWPITSNGKLDMKALPLPKIKINTDTKEYNSQLYSKILSLIQSTIKYKKILPNTNLIRLGITSIDVVRIANILEKEFGIRMQFHKFYKEPTVECIVRDIESNLSDNYESKEKVQYGVSEEDWEEGEL